MNVYDYIDQTGNKTFCEEPFNEIDAMLFSFLSYVDFGKIVEKEKITIKDVGRIHLGLHNKKENNITAVRDATNLLKYIKDTNRYKDCMLFNYVYEKEEDIQFSAISIEYIKNKVFISYEGTDEQISGWKENFVLSYEFPTTTHKKAISYLKKNYLFSNKELIIGGHSKGGNLALVAGMSANFFIRRRIKRIYNMDGPGLLDKEFNSKEFKRIIPIYTHILPYNSMVGIILNSTNEKVINTSVNGPLAHDVLYWKIKGNELEEKELSSFSKQLHDNILLFEKDHNKEEIKDSIENMYYICKKAEINTLLELKDTKNIMKIINECKELNQNSRTILYEFMLMIIKSFGYSKYLDLLNIIKKNK